MIRKLKILCSLMLLFAVLFFYIQSKTKIDVRIEVEEILDNGSVKFKISNFGQDLVYTGYKPSTPIFDVEVKRNERWVQVSHHWCGTGMEALTLKKKTALIYKYANYFSKDEIWRLKLQLYEIENEPTWMTKALRFLKMKESGDVTIYSEAVHARLIPEETATESLLSESE